MVTLVTTVGGASLGNYIFSGLESFNDLLTSVGCVFAALLALILDQLVHLLELAAQRRSRRLAWAGAGGLLLAVAAGLYYPVVRIQDWVAAPAQTAVASVSETSGSDRLLAEWGAHLADLLAEAARLPGRAHGAVAECSGGRACWSACRWGFWPVAGRSSRRGSWAWPA